MDGPRPMRMGRARIGYRAWMAVVAALLVAGCEDPFTSVCRTPAYREPAEAVEPKREIPPPIEEKSADPEPPALKPKPTPPPAKPAPKQTMVSIPPTPKPTAVIERVEPNPSLIVVTPSWLHARRTTQLKPIQVDAKTPPVTIGDRLELSPLPAKASLDGMIVAIVRLVGSDGKPVVDAEIEWAIDRGGVGVIVAAGGRDDADAKEYRRSSTLARCRTSTTSYPLARVFPTEDPITIRPGDTWCVLQSHHPGDMLLSARSADIVSVDRCQVVHRMHWYEAKLDAPAIVDAVGGEPASLAARVLNRSGSALAGYSVRYEVLEPAGAGFGSGARSIEKTSDSAGAVLASLKPLSETQESCRVQVQLFGRPVLPGLPTLLDDRTIEVRWSAQGSPDLEVTAPATAPVGTVVTVRANLARSGREKLSKGRMLAVVGQGVEVVSSLPEGSDSAGVRFALADLSRDVNPSGTELSLTSKEPGERRVRVEIRDGEKVHAAKEIAIRFIEPKLAVEKRLPGTWKVGQRTDYRISVRNVGDVVADRVVLLDEVPPGLRIDQTDGVRFVDRLRWELAKMEPGEAREFLVSATPERAFDRLAVRSWVQEANAPEIETFDELNVEGIDTVEIAIEDVGDPAPVDGSAEYLVSLVNRGSAPAFDIELEALLSKHLRAVATDGTLPATVTDGVLQLGPVPKLSPGESLFARIRVVAAEAGDARLAVSVRHPSLGPGLRHEESTLVYQP